MVRPFKKASTEFTPLADDVAKPSDPRSSVPASTRPEREAGWGGCWRQARIPKINLDFGSFLVVSIYAIPINAARQSKAARQRVVGQVKVAILARGGCLS